MGDIPFEGDDINHLRGWTPGEGSNMGSRYAAIPPPRSDGSRSRSGSRASSLSRREDTDNSELPVPDLNHQGMPVFRNGGDRLRPGVGGTPNNHSSTGLPIPINGSPQAFDHNNNLSGSPSLGGGLPSSGGTPPNPPPKPSPPLRPSSAQPPSSLIQRSRPLRGNQPLSSASFSKRVPVPQPPPEDPIIPNSEWANPSMPIPPPMGFPGAAAGANNGMISGPGGSPYGGMGAMSPTMEERGRRPRPITPPSRPASANPTGPGGYTSPPGGMGMPLPPGGGGFVPHGVFPDISPPSGYSPLSPVMGHGGGPMGMMDGYGGVGGMNGIGMGLSGGANNGLNESPRTAGATAWGNTWPAGAHADAPIIPNGIGSKSSPPTRDQQPASLPTPVSNSKPPTTKIRRGLNSHNRSASDALTVPTPTKERQRRGSGSSLSSIWKTVKGRITAPSQGTLAPGPPVRSASAAALLKTSSRDGGATMPPLALPASNSTSAAPPPLALPAPPMTPYNEVNSNATNTLQFPGSALEPPTPTTESELSESAMESSPNSFGRPRTLSASSGVSSQALSSGTEDRGRSEIAGSVRSRKSSMKSLERGPGEPRVQGLKVNFTSSIEVPKKTVRNISALDQKREGATIRKARGTTPPGTPVLRGKKRSLYEAREAVQPPPHFNLNDPAWPSTRRQDALERRHDVVIDQEPNRLVVYGTRGGVSSAVRELRRAFQEFIDGNMTQKFDLSQRAAHRIGLWAICQRLQNETGTTITVTPETNRIHVTGPQRKLRPAYQKIKEFARSVDDEKHTHYLVPSSKDLRRVLMIELPRLIAAGGGPEDEEEARQMFTISHPGEGDGYEMVVDLWCHPTMSAALTAGLRKTVEEFTTYRAREVWATRVSPWKMHALRNSHIFRRWDDTDNAPEGSEQPSLHTLEKRLGVTFLFPDDPRPGWDSQPIRNATNLQKEYTLKIRGSQAQMPTVLADIEDRLRHLLQVAVRIPASFHKDLKSRKVAAHLATLGVDADIKAPVGEYFECTLSATRQQDLDAGQTEISRMAGRISRGLPAVEGDKHTTDNESEREPSHRPSSRNGQR